MREPIPSHDLLVARLAERLRGPLPGVAGQARMAPRPRHGWDPGRWPPAARPAAALLLLFPVDGESRLVLTLRSGSVGRHRGQVSLPGGANEAGEDAAAAAVREAEEEAGVDPALVKVLGALTPLDVPVSGYVVEPIVAEATRRPDLVPCGREVARIEEARVRDLADPGRLRRETWTRDWGTADVPWFDVAGLTVWGATAMILAEFLTLAGAPPDPWEEARPQREP